MTAYLDNNILKLLATAKKKGYTLKNTMETPTEREARKQQEEQEITKALIEGRNNAYWEQYSLWANGKPEKEFTFHSWVPGKQQNVPAAQRVARKALDLTKRLKNETFNVSLGGFPGVGKTALALAMSDRLRKAGKSVMFVSTAELKRLYSAGYDDGEQKQRLKFTLEKMKEVDVLILDDFGTEGDMTAQGKVRVRSDMRDDMYRISNARVEKTTIITTNNMIDELKTMYDPKTVDRLIPKNEEQRIVFRGMGSVRGGVERGVPQRD
ncbi:ATP-binding protein [Ligilactobacillus saerimneri]|uniref:ATP-binding protein n=1 Tax=Ligilactobacillus saerimneri TaxID=228229 RepID=A0A7H9EJJ6_9LACO|nr:ATP-binding protein [Ligilactobacillus saerimneri]QLL77619.1 ATP-binding protein [Ligilactobacillus saerimneri]